MNDTFNPIGLDLTKNLHGHVRVETRSRWTGKVVDSQEKDNLVTNAGQIMIQTTNWSNASATAMFGPVASNLLGGLLLFDSTLTESVTNVRFPASAKLVGTAGQTANTSDALAGSYNGSESVLLTNGFTTVWDFLTSQANGTIASLARTSYQFVTRPAFAYEGNPTLVIYVGSHMPTSAFAIGYDETNHYLYFGVTSNQTKDEVSFSTNSIYRIKTDLTSLGLVSCPLYAKHAELVKTLTSSDGVTNAYYWIYDKYANNFVCSYYGNIHWLAMDGTHTSRATSGINTARMAVTENYYWFVANNHSVIRMSKTDYTQTTYSSVGGQGLCPIKGDGVFSWDNNFSSCYILYPDGTSIQIPSGSTVSGNIGNYCGIDIFPIYSMTGYQSVTTTYMPNYLGTIANLDSPVTKTSSQTMKITYTLTEA